jgi:hypothetical protein
LTDDFATVLERELLTGLAQLDVHYAAQGFSDETRKKLAETMELHMRRMANDLARIIGKDEHQRPD